MLIFVGATNGQSNYKVIKVNGTIVLRDKGVSLETGTVFSDKEDLLFRSEDATASVINSQKGRLILSSKNHDLTASNSNFLPPMYNISSRAGGNLSNSVDMENHFSGKYVVLDRQKLVIDDSAYPMDNNNFFFLRYLFKGEDINKKLDFSGDTLIIDKKNLYTVDGAPIPSPDKTSINLYYRKGKESILINKFDLIFPDTDQLKKEVKVILDETENKSANQKIDEVESYIFQEYGKIYRPHLKSWVEITYGLK